MKALILDLLGLAPQDEPSRAKSAAVAKIVQALESLDEERARYVAAFAYLLGRVANADLDVSVEETVRMEKIVASFGELPPAQAKLVVEIAKEENHLFGGTQNFQVAREFRELASRDERRHMLHCLFAVSAVDGSISGDEEKQLSQVAEEMGFSHREYIEVRTQYNDKRSVVRRMRGQS